MKKINHFATLDGLRGVAAFSVVFFHLSDGYKGTAPLSKAYLAVDFFFLLSGFVIAKAYEEKLKSGKMSSLAFVKTRLVRLLPLVFLATLMAYVFTLINRHPSFSYQIFGEFIFGILVLPHKFVGNGIAFPLDSPVWSLFSEFVINFVYCAAILYLKDKILYLIAGIFAVILVAVAATNVVDHTNYGLNTGGLCYQTFAGLVRCSFSFSTGVILYRFFVTETFKNLPRISGVWLGVLLIVSFYPQNFMFSWIYDLACVFFLYPTIIILGSRSHLPVQAVPSALWLGVISYPIYVLHFPIAAKSQHLRSLIHLSPFVVDGLALIAIVFISHAALTYYDVPSRRFLARAFLSVRTGDVVTSRI